MIQLFNYLCDIPNITNARMQAPKKTLFGVCEKFVQTQTSVSDSDRVSEANECVYIVHIHPNERSE